MIPNFFSNITWPHTRAFKYNLSSLRTHFESEGVKGNYLDFT